MSSTSSWSVQVPAGEVCAGRLAENGLAVALVERELVGGECSFYACMPSKGLLRPAQALAEAERVPGAAEAITGELDVAAVLARREEIVHHRDDASHLPWLRTAASRSCAGTASSAGERQVRVAGELLRARRAVVLAPGSAALLPPIPGLGEAAPWTNREVTTAARDPRLAARSSAAGSWVSRWLRHTPRSARALTLLESRERLIAGEEEFAAEQLRQALERVDVEVQLGVGAAAVRRAQGRRAGHGRARGRPRVRGRRAARGGGAPRAHRYARARDARVARRAARSPYRTRCRCPSTRGCTSSATPTAGRC